MAETIRHTLSSRRACSTRRSRKSRRLATSTARAEILRDLRARKGRFRRNRWHHGQRDQGRAWFVLGQPRRLLPRSDERRHRRQAGNREGGIGRAGQSPDEAFKIKEKAEKRAELYAPFAGILTASSQFDIELARLEAGKIIDIPNEEHARAQAGKDLFYPGAYVVPAVAFKAFRRKTLDAKDGVTAYLQNCLFIRKGEKLAGAGGPNNNEVFGSYAGYSDVDPTALAPTAAKLPARKLPPGKRFRGCPSVYTPEPYMAEKTF
jgi:hypothetical protein